MPAHSPDKDSSQRSLGFLMTSVAASALLVVAACSEQKEAKKEDGKPPKVTETSQDALKKVEDDFDIVVTGASRRMMEQESMSYAMRDMGGIVGAAPPQAYPQPLPGDINRERYEDFDENPIKVVTEDPVSTFSVDVDTASYSVMRRFVNDGALPPRDAIRTEELINYFDYDYDLPPSTSAPFKTNAFLYPTPWNSGTQILHIGIKGYDIVPDKRPDANLVLLLDVSGSMDSPDKLPLLKRAMSLLVNEMGENDTISIVVYAGAAGTVLEPTKGSEKSKILGALDRLNAGGSTAGGEGIRQAYALAQQNFKEDAVNRVIIATDGDFNVGINDPDRLEDFVSEKRDTGIFLTVLGFGRGNYNDVLMQKIAQAGNGNAAYIDTLKEARKVLVDEMAGTLFTIAKDVKIQVEFNPSQVAEYRLIGYETRILNREDFSNDQVDAGDIGSGHSVTALYEIVPVGSDARWTDPLRYSTELTGQNGDKTGEIGFVRVRCKLPDEDTSKLMETPVIAADALGSINEAPEDIRFAAAVAAFGQKLKGGKYLGEFGYDDIATLAQGAKGDDRFGYRAEFTQLVTLAESAPALPTLERPGGTVTQ